MNSRPLADGLSRAVGATMVAAAALAMAACAGPSAPPVAAPATTPTKPATSAATTEAPKASTIEVPRGIGPDYQSAQDLWRSVGLHVAPAEDATGANRIPVIDANWIVLSQDPEAGTIVAAGAFITATIKKDSDD